MGAMVERASSVPLSASCMVNRAEMLALVERARAELPVELDQAAELLVAHQEVISRAEAEAEELLAQAQADAEQMITESAVVGGARARSEQILDAARAEAARLLRECDLYCDNRLAALEDDLSRTLGQVRRGRTRLRDRSELDLLDPLADDADPQGYDVQADHQRAVDRRRAQEARSESDRRSPQDRRGPTEAYDRTADGDQAYDQAYDRDGAYDRDEAYDQDQAYDRDHAYDQDETYDQEQAYGQAYDRDQAYDQDQAGRTSAEQGEAGSSDPDGDRYVDADAQPEGPPPGEDAGHAGAEQISDAQDGRVPAGVGSRTASGPEHRVLDLTAVERAAERSGLG